MNQLFVRCNSGISGNMFVGALLDCGVPFTYLEGIIKALPISGYHLETKPVVKQGVQATYFNVHLHEHTHGHDHGHSHGEESGHGAHRGFTEIKTIIEEANLSDQVKKLSISAFYHLGMAEAKVHESTLEKVHFHEVGAVDCIIDIVGTMACLEYLKVDNVRFSPLHVGQGKVRCAHGLMDIPTPATAELLHNIETYTVENIAGELVTPTGAALVVALTEQNIEKTGIGTSTTDFWKNDFLTLEGVRGNGAGTLDLPIPNVTELLLVNDIKLP